MGVPAASQRTIADRPRQISERRLNMRLMSYWLDLRSNGPEALAERFDPDAVAELWPHCFTVIPADTPDDMKFDHIGATIAAGSGLTAQAMATSEVPSETLLGHALRLTAEVIKVNYPIVDSGEFTDPQGRRCLYRSILLPLHNDRGEISLLVGGARSRVLPPSTQTKR